MALELSSNTIALNRCVGSTGDAVLQVPPVDVTPAGPGLEKLSFGVATVALKIRREQRRSQRRLTLIVK
jgi:hypothetical protein